MSQFYFILQDREYLINDLVLGKGIRKITRQITLIVTTMRLVDFRSFINNVRNE